MGRIKFNLWKIFLEVFNVGEYIASRMLQISYHFVQQIINLKFQML